MAEKVQEIREVSDLKVACDGGAKGSGGALGHPRVYLDLERNGEAECPYCDCIYRLVPGAAAQTSH